MSGFVKIYGSILRSSVWQLPVETKIVWITMLALADENGVVESSIPGLAATAGVSIQKCEAALRCFMAPDRYSGSDVDEGRRIRPCRGGWVIINHKFYRELRTKKQVREADRIAGKRARVKAGNMLPTRQHVGDVADVAPEAEADTDLDLPDQVSLKTDQVKSKADEADPRARVSALPAPSSPVVLRTLPEGFEPSTELVASVVMLGLPEKRFRERLAELGDGPIGGQRGVLPHKLDAYLLKLAVKWRDWDAADAAKARRNQRHAAPTAAEEAENWL